MNTDHGPQPGRAYTPEQASPWLGGWPPGGIKKAAQLGKIPHTRIAGRICLTAEHIAQIIAAGSEEPVGEPGPAPAPRRRAPRATTQGQSGTAVTTLRPRPPRRRTA